MAHAHSHAHSHGSANLSRAFVVGIGLNLLFVAVEAVAGFTTHSLALLTDAGHNLSDVASLALSLVGFRLARVRSSARFTYGFSKATILIALFNALLLLVAVGGIGYEAVLRLGQPQAVPGGTVAWVAGIGILVNATSALLFFREKDHDLNVKGAYLHLAADALVSLGVVGAGLVMAATGWFWLDSAVSFAVIAVILISTWGLLRDSLRLSLDGVPSHLSLAEIRDVVRQTPGVEDAHHVHVWAMSTSQNALTAHVVVAKAFPVENLEGLKKEVRHALQHVGIQHATLEVEFGPDACAEPEHHAHDAPARSDASENP